MTKNTTENRDKLARDMVDSWDVHRRTLAALRLLKNKDFDSEWKQFYGED